MLGLEIIKQTIQQNSSNGMSEALRKKLAIVKINEAIRPISDGWFFSSILDRISNSELPDEEPVMRGETFYTPEAVEIGLVDGSRTMAAAIAEAVTMGREYSDANNLKTAIYNIV